MSYLSTRDLGISFGAHDVFAGIAATVAEGDRIGLVGPNGEGKTTLLRILAGDLQPTTGTVFRRKGLRMGYLPQDPPAPGDKTLWEDMIEVFADLRQEESRLRDQESKLAASPHDQNLLEDYAEMQHAFEAHGGYEYPLRIQQTLTGLGFTPDQYHTPLLQLSGGQRTRALLARLLLDRPDLLLLDEPTNHLDLQAVEWLENTLLGWQGAMVIVAHDRYFLDRVAMRIWEMAWGELTQYRGNYSQYVLQRQELLARLQKAFEAQQAHISKEEDYIRRNIAGQNTRQARGRRTRLQRMLREGTAAAPRHQRRMQLQMQARLRSGTMVLSTQDLVIGYAARTRPVIERERSGGTVYVGQGDIREEDTNLFRAEDVLLKRGERVGVIGPNGSGKTTFVKTILGQMPPLAGELRLGASLRISYLAQVQSGLDPNQTVMDTLLAADPKLTPAEARHILARFLFTGDDVFKRTEVLSGGQKSRLSIALLTRQQANFLILDEPTNHLDIESQEVLEGVLVGFNGTVVLVSHDRYLIDAVATQVWAIANNHLRSYEGSYSDYLAIKASEDAAVTSESGSLSESQRHQVLAKEDRRRRREEQKRREEADRVESQIHALETQLGELSQSLAEASQAHRLDDVQRLGDAYAVLERQLNELIESWASLA